MKARDVYRLFVGFCIVLLAVGSLCLFFYSLYRHEALPTGHGLKSHDVWGTLMFWAFIGVWLFGYVSLAIADDSWD